MTTFLFTHPSCFGHDTGPSHPEHPSRLKAVLGALEAPEFAALVHKEAPRADMDQLTRVHTRAYVEHVLSAIPARGFAALDPDTIVSPGSNEAALRAAGALCAAVDAVMAKEATNAFCAVRPPGHHAEIERSMGFCLFNNVAIGALHAHARHGCARVAILDFDVHHGNGTQDVVGRDGAFFFASVHQSPLYPGTGRRDERGVGNVLNVPLPPMADGEMFRHVWGELVMPRLIEFHPQFILVSAGFDGHEADPLAALRYHEDDFEWATAEVVRIARDCCDGRVVSALEGGYDLHALGASAAGHVRALMAA
jgi:acetoin utilization deacetylase AcuC-like enzyme